MMKISIPILLLAIASLLAFAEEEPSLEQLHDEERALIQLLRRGVLDCKKQWESCRGFPKCCGSLQCYWENGYSPLKAGVCTLCLDRDAKCQRNAQCCEPLVCHKSNLYSVDGQCGIKLPGGGSCHRDSQCQSDRCVIKWYDQLTTEVGVCANVTRSNLYDK